MAFGNLLPDEIYERMYEQSQPLVERLPRFFREDLVIRADGEPLFGEIAQIIGRRRVKRDEITGEPLASGDART